MLDRVNERAAEICGPAIFVALALVAFAFLGGLVRSRLAQEGLAGLLVDLRSAPQPGDLRGALSRTLGDPTLRIAYWRAESGGFVDIDGRPIVLPRGDSDRAATLVERDGLRVAALIHDATLLEEPELVNAVSAAASLALGNERLRPTSERELRNFARASSVSVLFSMQCRISCFGLTGRAPTSTTERRRPAISRFRWRSSSAEAFMTCFPAGSRTSSLFGSGAS